MNPEVPQLVEEPVELGLVSEVPGERGLAGPRVNFKVIEHAGEVFAEPPADDDPVAHVVAGLAFHVCTVAPARVSGRHPEVRFTQGDSVWPSGPAPDYHPGVGQAW